ncbi:MAG: hydrogenase maturation protease [Bacteroidales bacterium]|nr:hydrogenase maturation protease [Bacteroidales bacterium]
MASKPKILIYGYGNPGRQDDGLGAAFIAEVDKWVTEQKVENIALDTNYQLNIEDAHLISAYDKVIFVDATIEPIDSYSFTKVIPSDAKVEFTMHAVSPAFVVDLCQKLFSNTPEAWLLHLKGYQWEFEERLSDQAKENLSTALNFFYKIIFRELDWQEIIN